MKKKILSLVMIVAVMLGMVIGLTGCGSDSSSSSSSSESGSSSSNDLDSLTKQITSDLNSAMDELYSENGDDISVGDLKGKLNGRYTILATYDITSSDDEIQYIDPTSEVSFNTYTKIKKLVHLLIYDSVSDKEFKVGILAQNTPAYLWVYTDCLITK